MRMSGKYALGWIPDYPDFRDFTEETEEVREILSATGLAFRSATKKSRPAKTLPGAADLRSTIGAMVLFGVPPEEYWPYTDAPDDFDKEPPAFCYSFAQNYKTLKYYRHDPPSASAEYILNRVKTYLSARHQGMFGFTVYSSVEQASDSGRIPFPSPFDKIEGGHAVVAVGYDDKMKIKNTYGGEEAEGALLIRNSWGQDWGEGGYGWLPYDYLRKGVAEDFWAVPET